jgi:hypothetical protein
MFTIPPEHFEYKPEIWGPYYWFFLHTVALIYPIHPNSITKKKYYEFIQNFHLFIPNEKISSYFHKLVSIENPVTPYLDNRNSLVTWIHFIHNKVNRHLEKPEISIQLMLDRYYKHYQSKNIIMERYKKIIKISIYILFLIVFITTICYLYNK